MPCGWRSVFDRVNVTTGDLAINVTANATVGDTMFNRKLKLEVEILRNRLDMLDVDVARDQDVYDSRWRHTNEELTRINVHAGDTIELSHVDAHNVKVKVPTTTVLQAVADLLGLGLLHATEDEVVQIHTPIQVDTSA